MMVYRAQKGRQLHCGSRQKDRYVEWSARGNENVKEGFEVAVSEAKTELYDYIRDFSRATFFVCIR